MRPTGKVPSTGPTASRSTCLISVRKACSFGSSIAALTSSASGGSLPSAPCNAINFFASSRSSKRYVHRSLPDPSSEAGSPFELAKMFEGTTRVLA